MLPPIIRPGIHDGYIRAMYREVAGRSARYNMLWGKPLLSLKKQAERYPTALQKGLTESFMFEAGFSLMFSL